MPARDDFAHFRDADAAAAMLPRSDARSPSPFRDARDGSRIIFRRDARSMPMHADITNGAATAAATVSSDYDADMPPSNTLILISCEAAAGTRHIALADT